MHESYRNSLPLHGVGVDDDRSSLDNNGSSRSPYDILTIEGIMIDFFFFFLLNLNFYVLFVPYKLDDA